MGLVGFLTVYTGTGLQRVFAEGKLKAYDAATLIDKLIDRMLDRDVPRPLQPATETKSASAKAHAQAEDAPLQPEKSTRTLRPQAVEPETPRADVQADAPERYAQQSRTLREVRNRNASRQDSRARIDAILQKVGIESDAR